MALFDVNVGDTAQVKAAEALIVSILQKVNFILGIAAQKVAAWAKVEYPSGGKS